MPALDVEQIVGVVGAGTMGGGIAEVAALAGHRVRLYDARPGSAAAARVEIGKRLDRAAERGHLESAARDAAMGRLEVAEEPEALAPCGLVIEAIVETLEAKRELFVTLEAMTDGATIFATNTSSLSVTAIGAALERPQRLVGMHFFNPAPRMALVEVVAGLASGDEVIDTVIGTARLWGKRPVRVRSSPGFIVNRVARPFYAEALRAATEGVAEIASLDAVMRECGGFRMGPFELMDLIGHDVNAAVTASVFEAFYHDRRFEPSLLQEELVAAGRLGRKSGRGFYDYGAGATPPVVQDQPLGPAPELVTVHGELGPAESLVAAMERVGIRVRRTPGPAAGWLELAGVHVALTDGRTAAARGVATGELWVLMDLALDYDKTERIALAAARSCPEERFQSAAGLFQALGKRVTRLVDYPGLLVMRTVCMLANIGADTVEQRVCAAGAVDEAMRYGVNYPVGPLAWAEAIGLPRVVEVLDHLAGLYGDGRYRVAPLLRERAQSGEGLLG